jgi:hypothetical protein
MTRHTIERIIIEGSVDVGTQIKGTYPSLKRLEVRECLPRGIAHMSAPHLRRLTLRNANLRCCNCHDHPSDPRAENREALELLARTFPTVEILEVHKDLLELVQGMITAFPELKEVRTD